MDAPITMSLPCRLLAGWEVVEQQLIEPSQGAGFSAGTYRLDVDELWLLSDAPRGNISRWRGFRAGALKELMPLPPLPLKQPQSMDGEGLVVEAPLVAPLISRNLLQLGLAPDNWEVLLASNDNFNPLQRLHLARLVPRQLPACSAPPQQ